MSYFGSEDDKTFSKSCLYVKFRVLKTVEEGQSHSKENAKKKEKKKEKRKKGK